MKEAGIHGVMATPEGVEAAARKNEKGTVIFLLNHNEKEAEVILESGCRELLDGTEYECGASVTLAPKGVMVLKKNGGRDTNFSGDSRNR